MKTPILVAFALMLQLSSAHAQIVGVYKISKESPDAIIERIEFKAEGTADVVQVIQVMKFEGAARHFERGTKEIRVDCNAFINEAFDEYIGRLKQLNKESGLKDTESTNKLIKFRELGYDKLVVFVLKSEIGTPHLVVLVGKGDEFVDLDRGYIFKRSAWF